MQVLFTRVNEVETSYELFRLNVKLSEVQLLLLRAIFHALNSYLLFSNVNFTGGEGYSTNFYTGRLPFIYHFSRKRYSFRIPSIDKWNPFHIPCLELCIPLKCSDSTLDRNQSQKRNVFLPLQSHKVHLFALLGPFIDPIKNDRFPYPFIYFNEKNPYPFLYLNPEKGTPPPPSPII